MNRSQIEKFNKEATADYFRMLEEMILTEANERVPENGSASFVYLKLEEISKRWVSDEIPIWGLMADFFVGLYSVRIPFSFILRGNGKEISLYIGSTIEKIEILSKMLTGVIPQLKYTKVESGGERVFSFYEVNSGNQCTCGGYLKGNPTGNDNYQNVYQIDAVIKGMQDKPWIVSLFAQPVEKADTLLRQQLWMTKASNCSIFKELNYSETDGLETTSYKKNYFHSEQLSDKISAFCEKMTDSISSGEWCTTINFLSNSGENAHLLGGLLTSAFYGEKSEPEPVHAIYNRTPIIEPIVVGSKYLHSSYFEMQYPKYSTMLSSLELAVYAAPPTIDTYGLSVSDYVEFDVNRINSGDLTIGKILDSGSVTENTYSIDSNEFNRHCLVIGLTGSGKTNTIKSLICGLTEKSKRPFMVIEPAKKEYWELYKLGYDDLQIYSVGSNEPNCHVLCLNPFERTFFTNPNGEKKSVPIQTHVDFVYAAFKASFIMYTPMPYVLERAIYEIYEDCGWDIHNNLNKNGKEIYPTIEDLYFKIPEVVTDMGYDHKMRNDLIGSLQARINSMRIGAKGDTLNVRHSFSLDKLLNGNVVVELEDIGDDDVKAFIISLLLINLLEYRRQQDDCQLEVRHLMLIEEAHRLLKNVQSGTGENADPRGAAVEFFCNLLAELRSKGQGFIVADQIPSKLAPDLIKNTNLKITHRTVATEERELIGGAMHMTEDQIDSLASLKQGVAAVYSEGDNRPKLVRPLYAGNYLLAERKKLSRVDVLSATSENCISAAGSREFESQTNLRNAICRKCNPHCEKCPREILLRIDSKDKYNQFFAWLDPIQRQTCKISEIDANIRMFLNNHLIQNSGNRKQDENCLMNCLIEDWNLPKSLREKVIRVYNETREGDLS